MGVIKVGKLSSQVKVWVVFSIAYALIATVLLTTAFTYNQLLYLVIVIIPLLIGWGIWWVKRDN